VLVGLLLLRDGSLSFIQSFLPPFMCCLSRRILEGLSSVRAFVVAAPTLICES